MSAPQTTPELAAAVRSGERSAVDLVREAQARIDAQDGMINAVVARDDDAALQAALAIDEAVAAGEPVGSCAGVPTLVKDLTNVSGLATTFSTASMADFVAPFDDESVRRLRRAGFVILGKSNTPELGSLPTTEPLLHGPTRNPHALDRSAGGSSGGAAAAIAAGYVSVAHGSDGGGSLRIPASCCGVVGLKPSRGRVSHAPLFGEQVMGFATQGSLGRTVVDAAAMLDVLQGYVTGDPYHLPPPARPYVLDALDPVEQPLRIGLITETPWSRADDDVQGAVAVAVALLEGQGHEVRRLPLRLSAGIIEQFLTVWSASLAATPLPAEQMERHNQSFVARGRQTSASELLQAVTSLQSVARSFVATCETVDVVLAPTLMTPPLRLGALDDLAFDELTDLMATYLGVSPIMNVTGQPALALPVHTTPDGVPLGVQLIGLPGEEATIIRLGAALEAASAP